MLVKISELASKF